MCSTGILCLSGRTGSSSSSYYGPPLAGGVGSYNHHCQHPLRPLCPCHHENTHSRNSRYGLVKTHGVSLYCLETLHCVCSASGDKTLQPGISCAAHFWYPGLPPAFCKLIYVIAAFQYFSLFAPPPPKKKQQKKKKKKRGEGRVFF
jgi:hypothetical protein